MIKGAAVEDVRSGEMQGGAGGRPGGQGGGQEDDSGGHQVQGGVGRSC